MRIMLAGHRPKYFNNNYDIYSNIYIEIGREMRKFILEQMSNIPKSEKIVLISGMALGIDTIWALVAIKLKKQFPDRIQLESFVPCKEYSSNWYKKEDRDRFEYILSLTTIQG